jgi:hypothetical protein
MKHSRAALLVVGLLVVLTATSALVSGDWLAAALVPLGLLTILGWYLYENRRVYVSGEGECYHRANCGTLGEDRTALSLPEAEERGYRPCELCQRGFVMRQRGGGCACAVFFIVVWLIIAGTAILMVVREAR